MQDVWKILMYKDFKYCISHWKTVTKKAKKKSNVKKVKCFRKVYFIYMVEYTVIKIMFIKSLLMSEHAKMKLNFHRNQHKSIQYSQDTFQNSSVCGMRT